MNLQSNQAHFNKGQGSRYGLDDVKLTAQEIGSSFHARIKLSNQNVRIVFETNKIGGGTLGRSLWGLEKGDVKRTAKQRLHCSLCVQNSCNESLIRSPHAE